MNVPQATAGASQQAQQIFAANASVRRQWVQSAAPLIQSVASATPTYAQGSPTTVNLLGSATGLIKKFYLVATGTINGASGKVFTATPLGILNLLSNITFTDLNTRVRHNTTGAHMHQIQAARRGWPPGTGIYGQTNAGAYKVLTDQTGFGPGAAAIGSSAFNAMPTCFFPNTVTGGTPQNFQWVWEIPIALSDYDLRGAIWANQVTANNILSLTVNPNFFGTLASAADVSGSAYSCPDAFATDLPTLTNLKFTLYQDMLVQGPTDQNGNPLLPQVDLAYSYNLLMVPAQALQANADNVFFAAPNREILSHMLYWDNYTYNTLPAGSDVTSIKIQIANSLVVRQMEPGILGYWTRNLMGVDLPYFSAGGTGTTKMDYGIFYIDTRRRPLNVQVSGNVGLYFNPNIVNTGASLNIGYEYLEVQSATFSAPGFGL
jgi:hypothetical protein